MKSDGIHVMRRLFFMGIMMTAAIPVMAAKNATLPRFASLKSAEVNMRKGPGPEYPLEWVLVRKGMPVLITAEFDTWRKIKDVEGAEGWVHQNMLSPRPTVITTGTIQSLKSDPSIDSPSVARVEPMVVAQLVKCDKEWCQVKFPDYKGWLEAKHIWGEGRK